MDIPEGVIDRLPKYARALSQLDAEGRDVVSSQELGVRLNITHAQIRKDLSYFGRFGKQGRGYNVEKLLDELRSIVGLNRQWKIALVGVGRLGRAIIGYEGFAPQGFRIVAAFDSDASLVGKRINGLAIKPIRDLETELCDGGADIGIVATPADTAQEVIDSLVRCGVRAILNYAPIAARVPDSVHIKHIDPVLALQAMTYHLKADSAPGG
jgi:redox-sensing transcriptional repressor